MNFCDNLSYRYYNTASPLKASPKGEGFHPSPRRDSKSRFSLALECPTKLFYIGEKEYANQSLEDSFLAALAEGGFQVGELAKQYFPGGHQIDTLDY